ncbi:hypothetical protein Pmar_PMAR012698 [Perkinsus marinus ATCC 50983]|uniref:Uncharacterized protein n=1 Tax=Perkinsus marinus (strain ATCC 50983 / TXsc) TaxID=423536 RepID=C5K825_PERM5|nr:hypothetical protein Pmar_PMAR012698 [Perkinsus marinus ATCC 50983]EER19710.1 hypothetical protein Pmar_PMAR012698 [Perkinsus marinus ATCC 50983]|eukprot:XP_002787914.1 hypothetical protein Pmar_PMAR012698 [Perkinsus marinus ATCC 50983]
MRHSGFFQHQTPAPPLLHDNDKSTDKYESPHKWANEAPRESIAPFEIPTPYSAATAPTVVFSDWSPLTSPSRWTSPKGFLDDSAPLPPYVVPPASSWVPAWSKGQQSPPSPRPFELCDIFPKPIKSFMVPSSPTNFYTSCPRIDSPTIVDRRVEVVYSPASVKFCPPRKRLFQREGHCGGETMLDQLSPSACSPSWIDDGKRDRNIPRYSPPSAMPASPPSTRAYHPSSNSQQDDRFGSAWTVIWVDDVAFKGDAKAKKDSLTGRFKVRVKAYKSSEKCIRAFEKRYKEKPPIHYHGLAPKQIIVVSESNAVELLEYLHRGKEWLASKLIILGSTSGQLRRESRLISATVRNWDQVVGFVGRTLREAT